MKNRSRKTILAELNETVSNVPIRGTDEEKASSRMSREDMMEVSSAEEKRYEHGRADRKGR